MTQVSENQVNGFKKLLQGEYEYEGEKYKIFNEERKKIKIEFPSSHVVPREKVLTIEYVMDPIDGSYNLGELTVSKDAIIESVAEKILIQNDPVAVLDNNNNVIGIVRPSKLINVLFRNNSRKTIKM